MNKFILGKAEDKVFVDLANLNRHGFIAGATGTGKTISLKVMAENLSKNGVAVFLSDVKGDLASLGEKGEVDEKIGERLKKIGLENYENRDFPIELFDVFGEKGIALRTSISKIGPLILSKLLGLNDIQEGILNLAYKIADERGLLLIDIKDLRTMLNFLAENSSEFSQDYGNISKQSVGAVLRSLVILEDQGGDKFFAEPSFDIRDLIRRDDNGEGIINILSSEDLFRYPKLYACFLLWLLSELYESLPEIGDKDIPKIVFFFDEAHLLFSKDMKVLQDKIEMIVRLIRSKGVGVFLVSQKATDIPDPILSQLGNRIQHGLRAYTPKEIKELKAIANSFRQKEGVDLAEEIGNLKTGEAIVSMLGNDASPEFAKKTLISPPESKIGILDPSMRNSIINRSVLLDKYFEALDPESAYEILTAEKNALKEEAKEDTRVFEQVRLNKKTPSRKTDSMFDRFTKNIAGSLGREIGRVITRGIFGTRNKR